MLTVVSGFWNVKSKRNTNSDTYLKWFQNSLLINCPYVFYGTADIIQIVKEIRKDLPTYYVELEIKDFNTYKYYDDVQTDPVHAPSKELQLIWLEKLFLVQKTMHLNPFSSTHFMWIDSGICIYRDIKPPEISFPNKEKLLALPKNKFGFCSSEYPFFLRDQVVEGNYYHYFSMGSFVLHTDMIDDFIKLYIEYLDKLLPKRHFSFTEQVVLTFIYRDHEKLFHKISDGYGSAIGALY